MTVFDIITEYLKANHYDGLTDGDDCGCLLDDLMPCGCNGWDCIPGYRGINSYDASWGIYLTKEDAEKSSKKAGEQ